mmetsp:Transcript_60299/g.197241  ORF Transcript_60299/g.197241 Transcript_60299/m.197241 type:complete len:253 (+) Transcript_60299:330-1088(+)
MPTANTQRRLRLRGKTVSKLRGLRPLAGKCRHLTKTSRRPTAFAARGRARLRRRAEEVVGPLRGPELRALAGKRKHFAGRHQTAPAWPPRRATLTWRWPLRTSAARPRRWRRPHGGGASARWLRWERKPGAGGRGRTVGAERLDLAHERRSPRLGKHNLGPIRRLSGPWSRCTFLRVVCPKQRCVRGWCGSLWSPHTRSLRALLMELRHRPSFCLDSHLDMRLGTRHSKSHTRSDHGGLKRRLLWLKGHRKC